MKNFDEQLLRLKQMVKLTADKDVAGLLGMTKAAFSDRKKRGAFPEDKLGALAAQRPELLIDVNYVLTGRRSQEHTLARLSQAGGRIRKVRGTRTVAEFAAQIGTTAEAVSKVEAGEEWLSNELLGRIIEHEKLSPMWLLSGEELVLEGELSHMEKVLITNYRAASAEGKKALEVQAAFFATNNATATNRAHPEPEIAVMKVAKKRAKKAES
jgi:transcriptional regulator with XRE-family HTH domain